MRAPGTIRCRTLALAALLPVLACAPPASSGDLAPAEVESRVSDGADSFLIRNETSLVEGEVEAPLPRVWSALRETYESLDLPAGAVEDAAGRLSSGRHRARRVGGQRMSRWLDCGQSMTGPRADTWEVYLSVTSSVAPAGGDVTRLATTLEASARPADVSGNEVHCSSKGTLEAAIADGVRERVAAP